MVYQENDVELLGRRKSKFGRALAAVVTGGLSEVAKNKKLKRAVAGIATGGMSEVARNKKLRRAVAGIATGGMSEVARNKKLQRAVAGFATGGLSELGRIKRRAPSTPSQAVQQPVYTEYAPEYTEASNSSYVETSPAENVEEIIEYVDEAGNPTDSEGNPIEYVEEPLSGIDSNKILIYCAAGAAVWFLFFKGKK